MFGPPKTIGVWGKHVRVPWAPWVDLRRLTRDVVGLEGRGGRAGDGAPGG